MTDYERGYEQGKADALKNFDQVEKAMTAFWNLQRQWVGLTDNEVKSLPSWWPSYEDAPALIKLVKDVEAKLREKNGG